jgi:hypothetical protein
MAAVLGALDSGTVENLVIGLVVVLVVGAILIIRSTFKLATKLVVIVIMVGLGVALLQNRSELGRCSQTCACTIYGHDVEVPHLPFSCDY